MQDKIDPADNRLWQQTQRLLRHLNTERLCQGEIQQLLDEILGFRLHDTNQITLPFYTEFGHNIQMGQHVWIGRNVTLSDSKTICIGNDVEIAAETMLLTTGFRLDVLGHMIPWTAPITIKDHVRIDSRVIIQPGVSVGENAIILAGAIIDHDVPANAVVQSR